MQGSCIYTHLFCSVLKFFVHQTTREVQYIIEKETRKQAYLIIVIRKYIMPFNGGLYRHEVGCTDLLIF